MPLEKNDLVICDKKGSGGGMGALKGRLCLCTKVSSNVRIISTAPSRSAKGEDITSEIPQEAYWRNEKYFQVLLSAKRLTEFYVIDVDLCDPSEEEADDFKLADVLVQVRMGENSEAVLQTKTLTQPFRNPFRVTRFQRATDYGVNSEFLSCVTHLGHLLEVGDMVLGYDLQTSNVVEPSGGWGEVFVNSFDMPDVVLVKKEMSGGASEKLEEGEGGGEATPKEEEGEGGEKKGKRKKKSRRAKKKELNDAVKEQNGRGYRGAKTQTSFEDKLSRMGFLDDEKERKQWAAADAEEVSTTTKLKHNLSATAPTQQFKPNHCNPLA